VIDFSKRARPCRAHLPLHRTASAAVALLAFLTVLVPAANSMSARTTGSPRMIAPDGERVLEVFLPSSGVGKINYVSSTQLPSGELIRLPSGSLVTLKCTAGCSRTQRIKVGRTGLVKQKSGLFRGVVVRSGTKFIAEVTKRGWIGYYEKFSAKPTLTGSTPLCLPLPGTEPQKPRACQYKLSVRTSGTGSGHVKGSGIDCPRMCSAKLVLQTQATLTAVSAAGSTFAGWSGGGCSGTGTCTVTMRSGEKVTAVFIPTGSYEIAFHASDGSLNVYSSATGHAKGPSVRAGTSPSVSSYEIAFQNNRGNLCTYSAIAHQTAETDQSMSADTSPSIAASRNGGYEIAFQDDSGFLSVYSSAPHRVTKTGLGMKAGTSPSIVALSNGGYEIAFQDDSGFLSIYSSATHHASTKRDGMKAGTNPSIAALSNGDYEIAFQANTGKLYTYSSATRKVTKTGIGMKAGTNPSIAALSDGDYEIAFQANSGFLYTYSWPTRQPTNTALGMQAGTSPGIASLSNGGYEIAFQDSSGFLDAYSSATQQPANTNLGMQAGTSPSIAGS
jgi:hypothetical protein